MLYFPVRWTAVNRMFIGACDRHGEARGVNRVGGQHSTEGQNSMRTSPFGTLQHDRI